MNGRQRSRARGRRIFYGGGLLALLAAGATLVILPAMGGRATAPLYGRTCAERAFAEARTAGAVQWAAPRFNDADAKLLDASFEYRRQELRLYPFRDFRQARRQFQLAEEAAKDAASIASERRQEAEGSAESALDEAKCEVSLTEKLSRELRFGTETTGLVRTARMHLTEATVLWSEQALGAARLRADQAALESRLARDRMQEVLRRFVDPEDVGRWRDLRKETIAWSAGTGKPALVVNKDEAVLTLFVAGRAVRTYDIEIGLNHLEKKQRAGDEATPEGRYRVTAKKGSGESKYYKALELDYPNAEDRRHLEHAVARRALPANSRPGGLIEIHGDGGRGRDWTRGCVSLANADMDDLFRRIPLGSPVTIIGGDGKGGRFSDPAVFLASSGVERECRAH